VGAREHLGDYSELPTFNWDGPTQWPPRRRLLNRLSPLLFIPYGPAVFALELYAHRHELTPRRNLSMAFNYGVYAAMHQWYVAKYLYFGLPHDA
jgi:hypothetical protein